MRRHGLSVFKRAASFEVGGDAYLSECIVSTARRRTIRKTSTRCIGRPVRMPVLPIVNLPGKVKFRP
jgi:hypothetical protein